MFLYLSKFLVSCFLFLVSSLWLYGNSPYAPTQVGTSFKGDDFAKYNYDTASNRLSNTPASHESQIITLGLLAKPTRIQRGTREPEQFRYGVWGHRYLRVHEYGRKTFYVNGMEYRIENGVATSVVHIHAKGYSPDVQVELTESATAKYIYLLKDHLGSPVRTIKGSGDIDASVRFDPWGLRVVATGVAENRDDLQNVEKTRGYTGHEFIASAKMIHMNGRVYDSQTGLFAGPDRMIQGRSIAALNRFALGQNRNPNVTDPTGWVIHGWGELEGPFRKSFKNPNTKGLANFNHYHSSSSYDLTISRQRDGLRRYFLFTGPNNEELARFQIGRMKDNSYVGPLLKHLESRIKATRLGVVPQPAATSTRVAALPAAAPVPAAAAAANSGIETEDVAAFAWQAIINTEALQNQALISKRSIRGGVNDRVAAANRQWRPYNPNARVTREAMHEGLARAGRLAQELQSGSTTVEALEADQTSINSEGSIRGVQSRRSPSPPRERRVRFN